MKIVFSKHLRETLESKRINIREEWIRDTVASPSFTREIAMDEKHYFRAIEEFEDRCLKVVVNPLTSVVITAFFDRGMTKKGCKNELSI